VDRERRLRVVTWNVHGLRSGIPAVARAMRSLEPDVALVQESGPRMSLLRMGATLGMQVANDPFSFPRRRVKNAVLVRYPWRLGPSRLHRFARSARFYPRGVLVAEISDGRRRLLAASVHLGLRPAERRRHSAELERIVLDAAGGGSAVIAGDFNEFATGRAIGALSGRFADAALDVAGVAGVAAPTFPSKEPVARIDYVFLTRDLEILSVRVPFEEDIARASDHLPVVVEISLPR
jgi:endonuclease/exonuclease/phosphatase family metal-dependent hydrolase